MFILVNETGEAFLYAKNKKKSKQDILIKFDETNVSQPEGKIVLVFNQKFVWYPVFDRDDCDKSVALKNIVDKYASSDNRPVLTDAEIKIVDILKQSTRIIDDEDHLWAASFAAKLHVDCWRYFPDIFRRIYPRDAKARFNTSDGPNMMIARNAFVARISNWLCPATAELAAIAHQYVGESLDVIMRNMTSKYLDYVETRKNPRTGGLTLWFGNEVNFHNMDDQYLSKAANCIYSATDAAAIFDLAAIPDLDIFLIGLVYTNMPGGHAYTQFFRNEERGVIENTRWANGFDGFYQGRDGPVINTIIDKEGWVSLREATFYGIDAVRTSLAKDGVFQLLQRVRDLSGSNSRSPRNYSAKRQQPRHCHPHRYLPQGA